MMAMTCWQANSWVCDLGSSQSYLSRRRRRRLVSADLYDLRETKRKLTGSKVIGYRDNPFIVENWRQQIEKGELNKAVEVLDSLVQRSLQVDNSVFYVVLKRCILHKDLIVGSHVHALAMKCGYESNAFLANHFICMYASHGRLEEASKVFGMVSAPSHQMWASIILAHARHGQPNQAISLYLKMRQSTLKPDNHIYVAVLTACAKAKDLLSGRKVHDDMLRNLTRPNIYAANCLVNMYAKCASFEDALRVFESLPRKNVVTWNAMLAGYVQNGLAHEAILLYMDMQREGIDVADAVTYVSLLQACAKAGALHEGRILHLEIRQRRLEGDLVIGNSLINMYAKCGRLEDAREVFNNLLTKDVVTWNVMIAAYAHSGGRLQALELYGSMQQQGVTVADPFTFVGLLAACAAVGDLHHGKQLHATIQWRGLEADLVVGTSLVDMYGKCGSLEDARRVFDILPSRDVVTWTAMIAAYAQHGHGQEALALFRDMQQGYSVPVDSVTLVCLLQACGNVAALETGKDIHMLISRTGLDATDLVLANALVDMYGKCGSMIDAQMVFDALPARDIVTWSALISGYAHQGESRIVFDLFQRMKGEGVQPNSVTFLGVLTACSHAGLLENGQTYFEVMKSDFGISPNIEHYGCIVDLLGRTGHVERAMETVMMMPFPATIEIWRCVLGACQKWNKLELGLQAFEHCVRLDETDAAAYMLMSNIYWGCRMQEEGKQVQATRLKAGARKNPGQSCWTDRSGTVETFEVGDTEHHEWHHLYVKLGALFVGMKEATFINPSL